MQRLKHKALALGIAMAISGTAYADLNEGLLASYPFNGNANDESGNGNDGTVNGATLTEDRFGIANSAYIFDGVANKIVVKDTPLLNFGGTELSIAVWVKTTQTGIWKRIVTKRAATNAGNWYSLAVFDGKARFEVSATVEFDSISHVNDGNWHSIVVTRNPSNNDLFSMYIDGILESTMVGEKRNLNTDVDTPLEIGTWTTEKYNSTVYNGLIDDVRIYNRALSESEIGELYQLGSEPTKTYEEGLNEGIAKCQNNPSSCGITVPPESGNCPRIDTHASFTLSDGVLTIPAVDVPDIFGGVTTYRAEMSLIAGEGLVFSVTNAEPVQ